MGKSSLTNYDRRILLKRKEEIIAKIEELFTRMHVIVSLDLCYLFHKQGQTAHSCEVLDK